jgi:hypothetical protein
MQTIRQINGFLVSPILMITGFRFSKDYRWGVSCYHRIIYAMVDTVGANIKAGI